MPNYRYQAVNSLGKDVKGTSRADSMAQLAQRLRENDLFLVGAEDISDEPQRKVKLRARELSDYARQIGTMMGSGVPLIKAIDIMGESGRPKFQQVMKNLYVLLQQGNSLSDAMELQEGAFPELMISMFRVGEASGNLDQTAVKVAEHYEKDHRLHNKIISAAIYPCMLIVVTILVVIAIFTFVMPKFMEILEGMTLPLATRIVLWFSDLFRYDWLYLVIGVLIFILIVRTLLAVPRVRIAFDGFKMRIFVIGKLLRTIYTARFSRSLNTLYSSGVSIVQALRIMGGTIGNAKIREQLKEVETKVQNGESLSSSLSQVDGFLPKLKQIVTIGEETGKLDEMLSTTADAFDYDSEQALNRLVSILEPLLIVMMAVIVGVVVISVLQPVLMMYNSVG